MGSGTATPRAAISSAQASGSGKATVNQNEPLTLMRVPVAGMDASPMATSRRLAGFHKQPFVSSALEIRPEQPRRKLSPPSPRLSLTRSGLSNLDRYRGLSPRLPPWLYIISGPLPTSCPQHGTPGSTWDDLSPYLMEIDRPQPPPLPKTQQPSKQTQKQKKRFA